MRGFPFFRTQVHIYILLLLFTIGSLFSLRAQSITGRVADSNNNPIEFANIVLLNPVDSTFVDGSVSSASGEFCINQALQGKNLLQISYLGYTTKQVAIIIEDLGTTDVGCIVLEEDAALLNEVVVKTSSPPFARKGNSLIANVSTSLLSSAGTANDVIKRFPGISIKDNVITVFGKGSPVVYINNRKVYDESELQRLRSSEISTIELIATPGAKYDSEGRAVLLIKTKRNEENGMAVQVSTTLSQSDYFNHAENIGLTYTHNNLSFFASYDYRPFKRSRNPNAVYTVYADTVWTQFQDIPQVYKDNSHHVSAGMDWSVASNHALGAQYRGYFNSNRTTSSSKANDVLANDELYDRISTDLNSKTKPRSHLVNAFYRGKFGSLFGLQLDMDYMKSHSQTNQQINEVSSFEHRDVSIYSRSDFKLHAAKLTMDYRLGEANKLEFGGEYSHVKGSGFLSNPEQYIRENIYTNKEEKAAGFITYTNQFGKWNFQAGIRYEYVHSLSTEDSIKHTITDRNNHGFYPDISVSGEVGSMQMGLSLSRKTRRPSFDMLNSNNYYINRFLIQKGNPYLRNEDIYSVDYHLSYKTFDLVAGYSYTKNPIAFYAESMEGNSSQSTMTFANYSKYQEINALLSYSFQHKIWQSQLSTGIMQPFFSVDYLGKKLKRNRMSFSFEFNNDIILPKDFILSVNYGGQSKYDYMIEQHKGYHYLNVGLRKSFLDNRLSVNLQGEDIFDWVGDRTEMKINNISYTQKSIFETRYIILTVNYQFNNYKKKYRGKNAAEDDINRL